MDNFISKYNYQKPLQAPRREITKEEFAAGQAEYEKIKGTPLDFSYQYGKGIGIIASNLPEETNNLFNANQVHDKSAVGLSASNLSRVELTLGISSDSDVVNLAINKQLGNAIASTLAEFGLSTSLNSQLNAYTADDMLESANALINQGSLEIINNGGTAKELDEYLYSISTKIDDLVTEIKSTFGSEVNVDKDAIMGAPVIPAIRVWQKNDVQVNVVSQVFNIINSDGDSVEIRASYDKSQSLNTDDYVASLQSLNVEITGGALNPEESAAFNQFLDDFSKVTNAILQGDHQAANEAFQEIEPSDYGFQSIEKVRDNTYEQYKNDDELHIYNKDGHNGTRNVVGRFNGSYQDQSIIKGGVLDGMSRESVADLSAFDIKFANSHQVASSNSLFSSSLDSTGVPLEILNLSTDYGKRADGSIMQGQDGNLYRYEYNSDDRSSSGWNEINKDSVDIEKLKTSDYFNQYLLDTSNTNGQVSIKDTNSGNVIISHTKISSATNNTDYSTVHSRNNISAGDVFENKSGQLYQYQAASQYGESGWLAIDNNDENREQLAIRQQDEGIHKYLQLDANTGDFMLASMINNHESFEENKNLYVNMRLLSQ